MLSCILIVGVALVALFILPASTPRIDRRRYPNSLASLEQVALNASQQWILIRSENTTNPIVLFVHGGPGTSQLGLMRRDTRALEKHFTVVNWDQRGAGKSFAAGRDRAHMTMAQIVDDIIALSSYLTERFHQPNVLLVAHSWGSAVGVLAAAKRPDLFSAYVGIGQMSRSAESELLSYQFTLEQAQARADKSTLAKLRELGPPPYTGRSWRSRFMRQRSILAQYGGEYHGSQVGALGVVLRNVCSREYTMLDRINFFRGILHSLDTLFPELGQTDLFLQVPELEIPVYFCLGRHDREVPSTLSARYFEALKAPSKQLLWFENSSHMPNTEEQEKFNQFMIHTVLPALAEPRGTVRSRGAELAARADASAQALDPG
jgi:pimeloyl-ACP methyl ester carboxylesterase